MYIYAYIYACMHIYVYIDACIYMHACIYVYIYMHAYMYVYIYIYIKLKPVQFLLYMRNQHNFVNEAYCSEKKKNTLPPASISQTSIAFSVKAGNKLKFKFCFAWKFLFCFLSL